MLVEWKQIMPQVVCALSKQRIRNHELKQNLGEVKHILNLAEGILKLLMDLFWFLDEFIQPRGSLVFRYRKTGMYIKLDDPLNLLNASVYDFLRHPLGQPYIRVSRTEDLHNYLANLFNYPRICA